MNERVPMIDDQLAVRDVACAFLERDKLIVGGAHDAPRPRRGLHVRWGGRIARCGVSVTADRGDRTVYCHDAAGGRSET